MPVVVRIHRLDFDVAVKHLLYVEYPALRERTRNARSIAGRAAETPQMRALLLPPSPVIHERRVGQHVVVFSLS